MKWFVYNERNGKIEPYNIFDHGSFVKYVQQHIKNCDLKEDFEEALRSELRYYFWSKAEYEILISPWIRGKDDKDIKVDVYDQVMLNWNIFVDYVWENKEELLNV